MACKPCEERKQRLQALAAKIKDALLGKPADPARVKKPAASEVTK